MTDTDPYQHIFVNTQKAAKLFGVSENTLREWDKLGLVPCLRTPGGHRRYPLNALLLLINQREITANSPPVRKRNPKDKP